MAFENTKNKGKANGYASLGRDGKVPASQVSSSGGGNALSTTPLASITNTFTLTAGDPGFQALDLTGADISLGEDFWGTPGSAIPLDMSIVGGDLAYPSSAQDHTFDIVVTLTLLGDAADVGKPIWFQMVGNNGAFRQVGVMADPFNIQISGSWIDRVFVGDTAATISASVNLSQLTEPLQLADIGLDITQR